MKTKKESSPGEMRPNPVPYRKPTKLRLTKEQFMRTVKILCVPVEEHPEHDEFGDIDPGEPFWLHTSGMPQYGRPELEFMAPAAFVHYATKSLNDWALMTINEAPFRDGDTLTEHAGIPTLYHIHTSENPFWKEVQASQKVVDLATCHALTIVPVASQFACSGCGHDHAGPGSPKPANDTEVS